MPRASLTITLQNGSSLCVRLQGDPQAQAMLLAHLRSFLAAQPDDPCADAYYRQRARVQRQLRGG
jgi:hypothetical protein